MDVEGEVDNVLIGIEMVVKPLNVKSIRKIMGSWRHAMITTPHIYQELPTSLLEHAEQQIVDTILKRLNFSHRTVMDLTTTLTLHHAKRKNDTLMLSTCMHILM